MSAPRNREGFTPVERLVDLVALGQVDSPDLRCGFYILQRGRSYRCVFGFTSPGIHASLSPEAFAEAYAGLVTLGRELPAGGRLQLRLAAQVAGDERQAALAALRARSPGAPVDWLLGGEVGRVAELVDNHRRRIFDLHLFASWSEWSGAEARDWIDRGALFLQDWWFSFLGTADSEERTLLERLVARTAVHCREWLSRFGVSARLTVTPMQADELMAWAWRQLNASSPPAIPRLLRLGPEGFAEERSGDLAFASALCEVPPLLAPERVAVRAADGSARHAAVMVWEEKPAGFAEPAQQLRYLWTLLARPEVRDTEVVVELTPLNSETSRDNAVRLQRQATAGLKLGQRQGKFVDVPQQMKLEEAADLEKSFIEGARPLYAAIAFIVWREDPGELADACRFIAHFYNRPARLVREVSYAWKLFFQALPFAWDGLLIAPFDRRLELLDEESPGFYPLVRIHGDDRDGVEFLSEEGHSPVWLDLYNRHRNLALFGTTRSGKSVLLEALMRHALARDIPVVAMDFPKPDGSSTFSDYTEFIGGAYFDVGRHALNLFELPDLTALDPAVRRERLEEFQDFLVSALAAMVLGREGGDALLSQSVRSILQLAVSAFFRDPTIRARYSRAIAGGIASPHWQEYPTLGDLIAFIEPEKLGLDAGSDHLRAAFSHIHLRLGYWLSSRVGMRLSQPSTLRSDARLLVFALRNVNNEEDMAVLALANYAAALRRALATPASLFILDEAPILFESVEISNLVARLCANGAKAGVRVILSAQDPDTIEKAPASAKIFQNLRTRLIGRIEPNAIASFCRIFGYQPGALRANASAQFFPDPREVFSRWLIDDGGLLTAVRYYPPYRALAVVANNPDEQRARSQFLAQVGTRYPDRFAALEEFTQHYLGMLRGNRR
jgi:hypothetical protein